VLRLQYERFGTETERSLTAGNDQPFVSPYLIRRYRDTVSLDRSLVLSGLVFSSQSARVYFRYEIIRLRGLDLDTEPVLLLKPGTAQSELAPKGSSYRFLTL
jgi:hypothetical protein